MREREREREREAGGGRPNLESRVFSCVRRSNTLLATGSFDETVKIWDIRVAKAVKTINAHSEPVTSVSFNGLDQGGTRVIWSHLPSAPVISLESARRPRSERGATRDMLESGTRGLISRRDLEEWTRSLTASIPRLKR